MTQSLIAFTLLQLASLVIILAFAVLESLRSETVPFRRKLRGKQGTRPLGRARKRPDAAISQSGRPRPRAQGLLGLTLPGWPTLSTASLTLRRKHNDARADPVAPS
jgi:hypothetical protein